MTRRPGDVDVFDATRHDHPQPDREKADPEAIIEAFERVRAGDPDRFHSDQLPPMDLPGFGDRLEDCGDDHPHFCPHCGGTTVIGRTCNRSQCPRCVASWVRLRASSICGKLDALRRFKYATECGPAPQQPENMFYHHLSISPPADWAVQAGETALDAFERTLEAVKEVLDELGLEGVILYHPLSGEDGDDRGAWRGRLASERPWNDRQARRRDDLTGDPVSDELEFRPHFHVIGVAPFVDGDGVTDVVEDATGWVIHRITQSENSTKSITDDYSLARAVTYALSHTGLYQADETTQAAYRYFGSTTREVTAYEENQERIDTIVRAVAPRTLGIPYRELACHSDVVERAEYHVDMARAIGKTKTGQAPSAASTSSTSSSSSSSDDGVDRLGVTRDNPDLQRCQGRLLPIEKAPEYLEDEEWLENAEHSDELVETWREWNDVDDPPPPD